MDHKTPRKRGRALKKTTDKQTKIHRRPSIVLIEDSLPPVSARKKTDTRATVTAPQKQAAHAHPDDFATIAETPLRNPVVANSHLVPAAKASTIHLVTNIIRMTCPVCCRGTYIAFTNCKKDWYLNEVVDDPTFSILDTLWEITNHGDRYRCSGRGDYKGISSKGQDVYDWTEFEFDWSSLSKREMELLMKVKELMENGSGHVRHACRKYEVDDEDRELRRASEVSLSDSGTLSLTISSI